MIRGSCLCGGVKYELSRPPTSMASCHCSMCRKAHGAAFGTYAQVDRAVLRFTSGAELVRRYRSSPPIHRSFCSTCGSNLSFEYEGMPDALWLCAGTLDDDPGIRPSAHVFVGSKAPWYEITDALPQHKTYRGAPGE